MGDRIRYGIIGTGMMGIEHMLNIRLLDGAEVVAYADPHPTSRQWARDTLGEGPLAFENHRELLARAHVDAVVVATPNFTHASVLEDVFRTDKHVLVEKPLCTTLEDCLRVARAAERHPAVVWVAMEYRYMPPVARLVREVRRGTVGRLRMLAIREHRFPFLKKVGDWNRFACNTGGTLVEKCCHFFDLMNLIVAARPLRVYASGAQDVNHLDERYAGEVPDILDNAFAIVDYEGGARALLDLCMFAEASRHEQEIAATGDAGKVECFVPGYEVVIGRRRPRTLETVRVPVDERLLRAGFHHGSTFFEHRAFLDAVRGGGEPEVDVRAGLLAVALGLAAERSAREHRPVELAELGLQERAPVPRARDHAEAPASRDRS
jgi:myo-inositol 2-dehydrogenase/D-chiro-inositol 1-dehydrogenase